MTALVILALVALFIGLRLFSVLGERTGHEQTPLVKAPEAEPRVEQQPDPAASAGSAALDEGDMAYVPLAGPGVRALLAADPGFDVARFIEGAKGAYRMILERFWQGDLEAVRAFLDDNVHDAFASAVEARKAQGLTLDNRLIHIDQAIIVAASLDRSIAEVAVRFKADIAAVTRDGEGNVVAGSMDDAVQTRDRWTFRRDIASADPNWILVETDEEA
ncbi:Tim44/TimA family putative adaptor protein [Sphingomicrobium astaxanthinifaciens]|uniref:Tim44/TimA family putative adaptor protein n=1 Tax=Sphingomicrobium astaxanthinifaciens TaxID=1227949 RepID=UPI001FCB36A3|nr:Tim44/TimA family putative adaptor protein [Sphingomicrobium astaxanthinifaciens]MCJ7422117.1 Tim44/TimA family putative adaptor protein [Sphingomicrobium astaxanthinifaciens]